ncbi:hypothetical protein KP509_12G089900 [Ceratopteris richardii]|uniref:Uncharacterized protein n=1 Tax=Ceratopteris richardii TaxID=49495 RepID=A0A8T2TUC1_CERRI|nr:hypothetical protein KP509_12G089900 [Ceratopteris richardii]
MIFDYWNDFGWDQLIQVPVCGPISRTRMDLQMLHHTLWLFHTKSVLTN